MEFQPPPAPPERSTAEALRWLMVDRGFERGMRWRSVLVEVMSQQATTSSALMGAGRQQQTHVRPINSSSTTLASWNELQPLSDEDRQALVELAPTSEGELANAIAAAVAGGCERLGDVRWRRARSGAVLGERRHGPLRDFGSPARAVRLGKRCATPGCSFHDFHDGVCSHELELPARSRRKLS